MVWSCGYCSHFKWKNLTGVFLPEHLPSAFTGAPPDVFWLPFRLARQFSFPPPSSPATTTRALGPDDNVTVCLSRCQLVIGSAGFAPSAQSQLKPGEEFLAGLEHFYFSSAFGRLAPAERAGRREAAAEAAPGVRFTGDILP